jgi:hypothetical protein
VVVSPKKIMPKLILSITSEIGEFLIDEKDFEPFDIESRVKSFLQLKKDFIEELGILFKTSIEVLEDNANSFCAQLPMLGSVRLDWLEILDPSIIKAGIVQHVDTEDEYEADRKIRLAIIEMSKKYPERYELFIKPKK